MRTDPEAVLRLVDGAEPQVDPLDGVVERSRTDPGAPFASDVLERMEALRREDRPAFERLRAGLKEAGCRITALDSALRDLSPGGGERETQADRLVSLASDAALFAAPEETAYADIRVGEVRQTWPVRSPAFRSWLVRRYYEETERAPNGEAIGAALGVIEANARYAGDHRPVFVRTGDHDDHIYIDLGDDTWRAVEIDARGWRIVEAPPVRFHRSRAICAMPAPVAGGSIELLRPFLNVVSNGDFMLAVAWVLAALRPSGPYPLLALSGEQGTAKSTFSRIMAALVDPRRPALRSFPREDRDLFIAARHAQALVYDNVSSVPGWMSDALCRLSTGGGFATRKLHSDDDEMLFDAMRPVVLNGIEDCLSRPDLADRSLALELAVIRTVKPEREIWAAFDEVQPEIFGAVCDALSCGLRRLADTQLESLPRMADFAIWIAACEGALWEDGAFAAAYAASRNRLVGAVIEGDAVAQAVRRLATLEGGAWEGTASDMLKRLDGLVDPEMRDKTWPKTARSLSNRLTRASTFLRRDGVSVERRLGTDRSRSRLIRVFLDADTSVQSSSASSAAPDCADDADAGANLPIRASESDAPSRGAGFPDDFGKKEG